VSHARHRRGCHELQLRVTDAGGERRLALGLSQAGMAKALGTSQSRFSFIEKGDPSVSIDLALRALFETGMDVRDIAAVMAGKAVPNVPSAPRRTPKRHHASPTA